MILGIDVSAWQGEMDWAKAKQAGANFAFIRAGSCNRDTGLCYYDYSFMRNARFAPDYMPIGFYWYLRTKYSTVKQANFFCDLIKDADWKLPPVCDFEVDDISTYTQVKRVKEFLDCVELRTGFKPIIYTRAELWNRRIGYQDWASDYDLWVARYCSLDHPWGDGYCVPKGWDDWKFWQFSADGNGRGAEFGGQGDDMDLDYFNGTMDDFKRYIGEEVEQPLVYELNVPAGKNYEIKVNIVG